MKGVATFVALILSLSSTDVYGDQKPAHQCDQLAAHVDDKGKKAQGVSDEKLAPLPAIKVCSQAVLAHPNTARFHFQLGRAYWVAQQYKDAMTHLRQAVEMQYAPAAWYVGEVYRQGLGSYQSDQKKADRYYEIARIGGFAGQSQAGTSAIDPPGNTASKQKKGRILKTAEVNARPLLKSPASAVWEVGPPDEMPVYDQVVLDYMTIALIVLRESPEYVTSKGWRHLIERQLEHDRQYFLRKPFVLHGSGGLDVGMTRIRNSDQRTDGYHPTYIPFFPSQFFPEDQSDLAFSETKDDVIAVAESNSDAMELFKQWMFKRAESLPATVVIRHDITRSELLPLNFIFYGLGIGRLLWTSTGLPSLQHYTLDQIMMVKIHSIGKDPVSRVALLFPEGFPAYSPKLTEAQKASYFSYSDNPAYSPAIMVEYVMSLLKTEVFPVPEEVQQFDLARSRRGGDVLASDNLISAPFQPTPEFVFRVKPVKFRLYRTDKNAPMTPLTEGTYSASSRSSGH